MRLLLTGGGTAGHVYPALAVAEVLRSEALRSKDSGELPMLLYVGSRGGMEKDIVGRVGVRYHDISASGLRGKSPVSLVRGLFRLGIGLFQALRILGQYRPHSVLATGGYVCVPVVLAAWLRRTPVLIYLPDVEPGLAIAFLARFAARVAVTSEDSRRFFSPNKVFATGYPIRPEIRAIERPGAREKLGLPPDERVVLVVGGSRGAQSINQAVAADLPRLLALTHVVHVCGHADEAAARSRQLGLDANLVVRYHLHAYLHSSRMAAALVAADLVVSRAGASTLGEFPAAGLPSILVPYPYAGAHQRLNAAALEHLGAAVVLDDAAAKAGGLLPIVERLLADPEQLGRMTKAARSLDRPGAARSIADELVELGRKARASRHRGWLVRLKNRLLRRRR